MTTLELLALSVEAFDTLDEAYEYNHKMYHNYTDWGSEEYERIDAARSMIQSAREALKVNQSEDSDTRSQKIYF